MLALLLVTSFVAFPAAIADKPVADDKYVGFIENVLSVDMSKYDINLKINSTQSDIPFTTVQRDINNLLYELNSDESKLQIGFTIDRGIILMCDSTTMQGQFLATSHYNNPVDAVKGFIERYQSYTKIETKHLISMLKDVDINKDSTTTIENTKLIIKHIYFGGDIINFRWIHTVNDADYYSFELTFDLKGNFVSMVDSRNVFTLGDTSINVSKEQAINMALENLSSYSYEMPDGSVVKDFNITKSNIDAKLLTDPVDYVLNPYWRVEMPLDQVYPGSVQGITVIIWANTGKIHSYSNIAFGGIVYPDDANVSDVVSPDNTLVIAAVAVVVTVVVAALAVGLAVKRKRK